MRSLEQFVDQEVICNVSCLIWDLSKDEKYYNALEECLVKFNPNAEDSFEGTYEEVYEHWLVTNYLYDLLAEKGEAVCEFKNLYIWGRTCSGQSISCDYIIQEIYNETHTAYLKGMQD